MKNEMGYEAAALIFILPPSSFILCFVEVPNGR